MGIRRQAPAAERHGGFAVELSKVSKTYGAGKANGLKALDAVSLNIKAGQAVALVGPSGSGKSTLLHLVGAMDAADRDGGRIVVDGNELTAAKERGLVGYRRTIGFVFQRFHLVPALTALDNVVAPVLPYRTGFDKRARAAELLDAVGLGGRGNALPSQLSGGQQQRVAIARALINRPGILLADEPTGALDSTTGTEVMDLLLRLRAERGLTLLLATHDAAVAGRCDRRVAIADGRIIEDCEARTGTAESAISALEA